MLVACRSPRSLGRRGLSEVGLSRFLNLSGNDAEQHSRGCIVYIFPRASRAAETQLRAKQTREVENRRSVASLTLNSEDRSSKQPGPVFY